MKGAIHRNKSFYGTVLLGLVVTFIPVALLELQVLRITGNVFMYPVDDSFIHMEVAKNLAENGTWGINSNEFGSASSSLLYTLILAALFKIFSASTIIPFVVNCIAAAILVVVASRWLARQALSSGLKLLVLSSAIMLTPLPIMVMSGMEHTLQCLFAFLFLFGAADWMEKTRAVPEQNSGFPWKLALYGMLVTAIRYEGLFLVGAVCLALLFYRRFSAAVGIGVASLLPVVIFGLVSISKGSYFLPNSVLIKSDEVPLFGGGIFHFLNAVLVEKLTLSNAGITAMATQRLLLILPLCYLSCRPAVRKKLSYHLLLIILTAVTLLHLSLASTGKFYRYEAYLVFCSAMAAGCILARQVNVGWRNIRAAHVLGALAFFFLLFPLVLRMTAAFTKAKQACINIYEQQYQMGRFLQQHYPAATIAANDIGAVSFYTRGTVVDLWGLGSIDIARSRKNHYWNASFLDSMSRQKNTKLAIIYDSWFRDSLGKHWQKVATWQISNNVVCGDDIVSFYAVDSSATDAIRASLQQYQKTMPGTVAVTYY